RPKVDSFVLDWLLREPLRKVDFFEDVQGNVRIVTSLATELCKTSQTWFRLVAPVAEHVAQELMDSIRVPSLVKRRMLASRLTQMHRREVKGSEVPSVAIPKAEHVCSKCGSPIHGNRKICLSCWKKATPVYFAKGRKMAQSIEHRRKKSDTMRAQQLANREF